MINLHKLLKEILSTVNDKRGLNKGNIIEEIREELREQVLNLVIYLNLSQGLNLSLYLDIDLYLDRADNIFVKNLQFASLWVAAEAGYIKVLNALIALGVNVHKKNFDEATALHYAALNGHAKTVEVLIQAGANVHEKDCNEATALHLAVSNDHADTIKVLLDKGANVNAVDKEGKTPLYYAKNQNVVETLLKADFVKTRNKAMIAGGTTVLLGYAISVALFATGTVADELISRVIAMVAVTAAALVVGGATYMLLKLSTKVDGVEKPPVLMDGRQEAALQ